VSDNPIELLGFYSTGHRGVFTHGNSDSHVHFYAGEKNIVGHVDELSLTGPFRVMIPER
jgi:acetolactate decarboxylase